MFNKKSSRKNSYMLNGKYNKHGYDWWWHNFTGYDDKGNKRHFFVEYFIINPKRTPNKVSYGRLGESPSYVMVKCGSWGSNKSQLHKFYPTDSVKITKCPYELNGSDFYASDTHIKGNVNIVDANNHPEYMCDNGSMEWDLNIDKQIAFNVGYGTSRLCCFLKAFEMYWHAEGMKSAYDGYVIYNGIKYTVSKETSNGYADKNWGANFTSPWIWISSNILIDNKTGKKLNNSVFDIGGGRPKVYFVPIKDKLLGAFYFEGKEYEFNFSKFWHPSKTNFNCYEEDDKIIWNITQKNSKYKMELFLECKKDEMLHVNYESPDGRKRYNRLWNGGNGVGNIKIYKKRHNELLWDVSVIDAGCEYGVYDN